MCRLFIGADARLWRTRLKSVRMRGYSTSVRLENFYWRVLEDIARRDGMNVPQLLAKLHEELIEAHGEIFDPAWWRSLQDRLRAGDYVDVPPYPPEARLAHDVAPADQQNALR